ncbi:MAG TPA: VOC family protein, partial [Stellaceae bacterium]|nr:VOC family protein [Stellaceae bacterium]
AALHLRTAGGQPHWVAGHGALCVFVDDVDALHAEFATRGARIVAPPQDYDYGMRDFDVADLDGNRVTFGMESKAG